MMTPAAPAATLAEELAALARRVQRVTQELRQRRAREQELVRTTVGQLRASVSEQLARTERVLLGGRA